MLTVHRVIFAMGWWIARMGDEPSRGNYSTAPSQVARDNILVCKILEGALYFGQGGATSSYCKIDFTFSLFCDKAPCTNTPKFVSFS